MALVNGSDYDHFDLHPVSGGDVTRHMFKDAQARQTALEIQAALGVNAQIPLTWENGTIDTNGTAQTPIPPIKRIRSSMVILTSSVTVSIPEGMKLSTRYYAMDGTYEGWTNWITGTQQITIETPKRYRFVAAYADDSVIDASAGAGIVLSGATYTDASLSMAGKAADAKATGDALAAVSADMEDMSDSVDTKLESVNDNIYQAVRALGDTNVIPVGQLGISSGYWDTSGNLIDSSTTYHTNKISADAGKTYRVDFPSAITTVVVRQFNASGGVLTPSHTLNASGTFTTVTGTTMVAFNAVTSDATVEISVYDTGSNLALKSEVLINLGVISSGTHALTEFTDIGWHNIYAAVTITDRPTQFPRGGFFLRVTKTGNVVLQEIFPYDYSTYAYRIIGKDWNVPYAQSKPYQGKTISIIGDSLSDKANSTAAVRYYDVVDEVLGTVSTEYAMSGCGYSRKYNNGDAFYEQAAKIATTTDLVLIFGSFNDHNVYDTAGLGEITDTTTETVFGCVNYTLQTIFDRAPKAVVGIMLPTPWAQYPPYNENTLQWQYVDGIKQIAKRYSIPVLDLYSESNMRPWDETFRVNFYKEGTVQDSGTHPNSAGHRRFAPQVVEFVKRLLEQS